MSSDQPKVPIKDVSPQDPCAGCLHPRKEHGGDRPGGSCIRVCPCTAFEEPVSEESA